MHQNMTLQVSESFHVTETREENGYYRIYIGRTRKTLPSEGTNDSGP